jgi:hypothetical protein
MTFLQTIPKSKVQKDIVALDTINDIVDGNVHPLDALAILKHLEELIEVIKNDPQVINAINIELDKYGRDDMPTVLGYKITRAERKSFDFTDCGDIYLSDLKAESKKLSDKVKMREKFLQSLQQKVFDSENGGFEIMPPVVKYTQYFKLQENNNNEIHENQMPF